MTGSLAVSWGPWGGFYLHRGFAWRLCIGRVALTYVPVELDDLMEAYSRIGGLAGQPAAAGYLVARLDDALRAVDPEYAGSPLEVDEVRPFLGIGVGP